MKRVLISMVMVSLFFVMACNTNSPSPNNAPNNANDKSDSKTRLIDGLETSSVDGNLRLYLTDDAHEEFDEIRVNIAKVEIHKSPKNDSDGEGEESGSWITLAEALDSIDLLELQNDVTTVLKDAALEEGHYSQIRLITDGAVLVREGQDDIELKIPSGEQSGIKLNLGLTVEEGKTYGVVLDYDAGKSIKKTGKPSEDGPGGASGNGQGNSSGNSNGNGSGNSSGNPNGNDSGSSSGNQQKWIMKPVVKVELICEFGGNNCVEIANGSNEDSSLRDGDSGLTQ